MPKRKRNKKKKEHLDFSTLKTSKETQNIEVPPYRLENVVSTFSLGCNGLNLKKIALKYRCIEFNPAMFAAATLRIKKPRTTALAFASGNMVCTGSKSTLESRYAARKYCRVFQHLGIPVMFQNFKIQNIVASANTGFPIKLKEISEHYGPYTNYESDLFPGLIFRSVSPKLVFLIFRSGKCVITGAKNVEQIKMTYESLYRNILIKYKDVEGSTTSSSIYRNELRNKREISDL